MSNYNVKEEKARWRRRIWELMEERGIAAFPRPVYGRIPNFIGAEKACEKLTSTQEWRSSLIVKVNPDAPQRCVRRKALEQGKKLVMPTPRLREGFLLLDPQLIPRKHTAQASTIKGAFKYGVKIGLQEIKGLGKIDLIVEGSVVVNRLGERLGKGEGYGELEYGILSELGLVGEQTPIATTVHDVQVVEQRLPQDPWDVPIDLIATPSRIIRCARSTRPKGILWEFLPEEKKNEIPILRELEETYKKGKTLKA